jgi:hypothetical protein
MCLFLENHQTSKTTIAALMGRYMRIAFLLYMDKNLTVSGVFVSRSTLSITMENFDQTQILLQVRCIGYMTMSYVPHVKKEHHLNM